jgi:pyruvate kinase
MRKTKIVCTIGPASETEQIITGLCKAGMNVARLNFSHNTHEDHLDLCQYFGHKKLNFFSLHSINT